jgi:protein TonB
MRVTSSALSLTLHVGLVLGAVWATARGAAPAARGIIFVDRWPLPIAAAPTGAAAPTVPNGPGPDVRVPPDLPIVTLDGVGPNEPAFPAWPGAVDGIRTASFPGREPVEVGLVDDPPVLLAGRIPAYPELLRQAGVEGRVVLEAVVDTLGRVEAGSITVVAATHLAFVASARQALAGALFRPARVGGRAVRVRVRFPAQFMLRNSR